MQAKDVLPSWNSVGVLPPCDAWYPTVPNRRSPYRVSLIDVIRRFALSSDRCVILNGLLGYRAAMHAAGLKLGFQWIDGSFLEDVETVRGRPPNDVDVVNFVRLATNDTAEAALSRNPDLFDPEKSLSLYKVHGFLVSLEQNAEYLIAQSVYWYGVWSHRRSDRTWKGFIEIDMSPTEDEAAIRMLEALSPGGGP